MLMTKTESLYKVAQDIIKVSHDFHVEKRDIVGELYDNSLYVDKIVAQEMERIRLEERRRDDL